jgi:intraflagellar transport protein 122
MKKNKSGTHKKASLYSRNGGFLIDVCTKNDWVWSAKLRTKDMFAMVTTNDGQIS